MRSKELKQTASGIPRIVRHLVVEDRREKRRVRREFKEETDIGKEQ